MNRRNSSNVAFIRKADPGGTGILARFRPWLLALLAAAAVVVAGAGKSFAEPVRDAYVEAELISGEAAIVPGQRFTIGLRLVADETWHTYWLNPASPGYVTTLDLELPEGFQAGSLQFPYPHQFTTKNFLGPEDYTGYGYEGEEILLVDITAPEDLAPGSEVIIKGTAKWLVCDPQTCVPGEVALQLSLPVLAADSTVPEGANAEAMRAAKEKIPAAPGWQLSGAFEGDEVVLEIAVAEGFELPAASDGGEGKEMHVYPLRHDGKTQLSLDEESVIKPGGEQKFSLEAGVLTVRAVKGPIAPEAFPDPFEVVLVSEAGFGDAASGRAVFLSTDPDATGASATGGSTGEALAGEEAGKGGEGWGYWLQRPFVVMLLASLMFGLALSLFGVFEVGVGLTSAGGKLANSSGLAGSFFSGALATVLATPCTAPFMGGAIAFALGQPAWVTMAVFTALGFGMVLPYLLLSIFPKAVQKLPRPGPWMDTFKQIMGFPMIVVVAWLLWVLTFQVDSNGMLAVFVGLILLSLAGWWYGRYSVPGKGAGSRWTARVAAILLVVAAIGVMAKGAERERVTESRDVGAEIAAIQESGKGVFVDFTATWCLTCQGNKAVMHSDEVEQAFADHNVEFLEVDWTQREPETLAYMEQHGRSGVPLYLLFSSDPEEPPVTLKNLFTSNSDIIDVLEDRGAAVAANEARKELTLIPALIAAMIGGLILNLMPCVFPVISLKIMGFVSQSAEDRRTIFHHGLAFAGGAMLFFWILAGSLVLLRSSIAG